MNPKGERNIPASIAFVLSQRPASIASVKLANRGTPLTPQGALLYTRMTARAVFLFASLRPALQAGQAWPHLRKSTSRRRCRCPRSEPRAAAHAGSLPDQEQAQPMPERLQNIQGTQEAAGRAGAAARLSARQRGRTCPGSAAAGLIDLPRAEGAAGALDPGREQLPALDLSRIRSRPGHAGAPKSNC